MYRIFEISLRLSMKKKDTLWKKRTILIKKILSSLNILVHRNDNYFRKRFYRWSHWLSLFLLIISFLKIVLHTFPSKLINWAAIVTIKIVFTSIQQSVSVYLYTNLPINTKTGACCHTLMPITFTQLKNTTEKIIVN